jgi:hypothetical protein
MSDPKDNNGLSVQLARLESKLDGTGKRLDDFSNRMDRFEEQRDLDRKESQVIGSQLAGIAATCRLHVEQTNSAAAAASEAIREAAGAKSVALQVESSWNDLRKMTRPSGSAEHQSVTKALEERARFKEQEREGLETSVVNVVLKTFEARDQAERENRRAEAELLLKQNEDKRKEEDAKRKRITWLVGIVITVVTTISGTGIWNLYRQAREERQQVIRVLDNQKQMQMRNKRVDQSTAVAPLE